MEENISIKEFLEALYSEHLEQHKEYIETRILGNNGSSQHNFFSNINDLLKELPRLNKINDGQEGGLYFGVAPRKEKRGTKQAIKYLTSLWADIDTGTEGHKKKTSFKTQEEALVFLESFPLRPSIIVGSGNGLHCYWLLKESYDVTNISEIESILNGLLIALRGDTGTGDIPRILRLPGSNNWKESTNPKLTKIITLNPSLRYNVSAFEIFAIEEAEIIEKEKPLNLSGILPEVNLTERNISPRILNLITEGDRPGFYTSRSERDQAVITELLLKGLTELEIKAVFNNTTYSISDKYMERGKKGDWYLGVSIRSAKEYIQAENIKPVSFEIGKEITIPRGLNKILNTLLKGNLKLWDDKGFQERKEEGIRVFEKATEENGTKKIIRYIIPNKNLPQEINLDYMKQAYITSLAMVKQRRDNLISFTLQEKLDLLGRKNISGRERDGRTQAEYLLSATRYEVLTLTKDMREEEYINLYAGIRIITDLSKHRGKIYEAELSKLYLKDIDLKTGNIEGGFDKEPLKLSGGNLKEQLYQKSLNVFKKFSKRAASSIPYRVMLHLKRLDISERELKRPVELKKLWDTIIEPSIRSAGHKWTLDKYVELEKNGEYKELKPEEVKNKDDIRFWQIKLIFSDRSPLPEPEEIEAETFKENRKGKPDGI